MSVQIGEHNYSRVYTDGSCLNGTSKTLARAGWGVFFGKDSTHNVSSLLHGPVQTSFRAEVRALLHVISIATERCLIMVDCKSVVTISNEIMEKRTLPNKPLHENDLWEEIANLVANAPQNFFIAQWMPSHLEEDKNKNKREKANESSKDFLTSKFKPWAAQTFLSMRPTTAKQLAARAAPSRDMRPLPSKREPRCL